MNTEIIRSETLKRYRVKLAIIGPSLDECRRTTHVVWASCVDNAIARAKQNEIDYLLPCERFSYTETQKLDD